MTWFKVDDAFHSHPKVLATPPAALGLWVVAGAWSSANLTDGFVPDHVLPRLLEGAVQLARELVTTGLWRKVRSGYQFHDWTAYNPSSTDVRELRERRAEAGRLGGQRSAQTRRAKQVTGELNGVNSLKQKSKREGYPQPPQWPDDNARASPSRQNSRSKREANAEALASDVLEPPTRPDPLLPKGRGEGGAPASLGRSRPPKPGHLRSCPYQDRDPDTCSVCASERKAAADA